jgi:hypothetical protein
MKSAQQQIRFKKAAMGRRRIFANNSLCPLTVSLYGRRI